jgi:hypothetical protein
MLVTDRINKRLAVIRENMGDVSWKDPDSPNYDRQWAEDALYHTIGPLMDTPRWSQSWTSPSQPVPGFTPGGPAPRWTPNEVVIAMAGDPKLAFAAGGKDNPRSPAYGNKGGSPLWRTARRVAKIYNRDRDKQFISDMYSNGFIPLVRMMKPGFDEGRSPFISYVIANVQGAMQNGVGGTEQGIRAKGGNSTSGLNGLDALLNTQDPNEARKIADQIKGKYQSERHHDKHADNPFGPFSPQVYRVATLYAQALESGDPEAMERAQSQVAQVKEAIDAEQTVIPGASTGMGQAISTPDRKTSIKVGSMDVSADEQNGSMAGNIPTHQDYEEENQTGLNQDTIFGVLDVMMAHDLTRWLANDPELAKYAEQNGWKPGEKLGKLTANELRYLIRKLGPLGTNYPGRGTPRRALDIPRDGKNWWQPLEDPEIEPIPNSSGALWKSIWSRNGFDEMGSTEIARELTEEVREFEKLGIPTARKVKVKAKTQEVISKVAVHNALTAAYLKLKIVFYSERDSFGIGESKRTPRRTLLEDYDPIDRRLILEALDWMIRKLGRDLIAEGVMDQPPLVESGLATHIAWRRTSR